MDFGLDTIFNEDCLVGMNRIPDHSVDMICCDLPYGVLNKGNKDAKWDSIIPFEPLWEQYERVIKDNGAIVLFAQGMFTAKLMMSNERLWRYNIIWDKGRTSGHLNVNRMPLRQHEDIVVFYKQLPVYHPQMVKDGKKHHRGGQGTNVNHVYGKFNSTKTTYHNEKYPTSIIQFNKVVSVGKTNHPTEKPVDLISWLIRTYSNEGDVILDNCIGSGTTAISCLREHRHWIGFESNKEYYDKACERIRNEQAQLKLQLL